MSELVPVDPDFESRVRASFARQRAMGRFGAELGRIAPGEVDVTLPYDEGLTQQHGFVHAGVVAAIADSACGYAALTLMSKDAAVLSIECKLNLLAPAVGLRLRAHARVRKAGRTVTVCEAEVFADDGGAERLVALMLASMMTVRGRPELRD